MMPKKFKENEITTKYFVFTCAAPSMTSPSSSGKGEAIIKAPINGRSLLYARE